MERTLITSSNISMAAHPSGSSRRVGYISPAASAAAQNSSYRKKKSTPSAAATAATVVTSPPATDNVQSTAPKQDEQQDKGERVASTTNTSSRDARHPVGQQAAHQPRR